MLNYDDAEIVNVGTGVDLTILKSSLKLSQMLSMFEVRCNSKLRCRKVPLKSSWMCRGHTPWVGAPASRFEKAFVIPIVGL